ncbi:gamma-glutamyltransferase [Kiloniella laminariae]|uniref:gamma-glutamyltransferase n=1 Tax=Kiloniella laminariae TaxID=454162 RepID=UPI00146E0175|nr:gamma-glutamyltransferase [Kiloniella laminariae]
MQETFFRKSKVRSAIITACLGGLLLSACESADDQAQGTLQTVKGFAGLVSADEPRAAQIGRELLGNGATAADTAVAMYFTMTVTMPSRVGVAGGGACSYYDKESNSATALNFLPSASSSGGVVPKTPRAMAALHAKYGSLRWEQLVTYGERLARFGNPVSRSFAYDLALANSRLGVNAEMLSKFTRSDGKLPSEGDILVQPELSGVLAGLRAQGAGYLYMGPLTRRFAEASTAEGLPLKVEDIRDYLPNMETPLTVEVGVDKAYFSGDYAGAALVAAHLVGQLNVSDDYNGAEAGEQAHLFTEALKRAQAIRSGVMAGKISAQESLSTEALDADFSAFDEKRATPVSSLLHEPMPASGNPYAAGFAVIDRYNNSVACSFTLNGLFGSGRMAQDLGVVLPAPPRSAADGLDTVVAVVVANEPTAFSRFAGTASEGAVGASSLSKVMADTLLGEVALKDAITSPRLHHSGQPDVVFYEENTSASVVSSLKARGHDARPAPEYGRVNAAYCAQSLKFQPESCSSASDNRGFGLSRLAQ